MSIIIRWRTAASFLAVSLSLDKNSSDYALRRLDAEGVAFLTKTLPKLSKAVVRGLETGHFVAPTDFCRLGKSHLPRFLSGWVSKVFSRRGRLVEKPCAEAILKIRQFCEYFYKLSFSFSEEEQLAAYQKAVKLEDENHSRTISPDWLASVRKAFFALYGTRLTGTLHDVLQHHRPRYTPGAFFGSEGLKDHFSIYKKLPSSIIGVTRKGYRGIAGYFRSYPSSPEHCTLVNEANVSKTLLVPKDSRGPRLISKEPLHMLRLQMSFFDYMTKNLERLSNNRINFLDQGTNRELARESSINRKYSTLDLKDASDRILFKLAIGVFRGCPSIEWFLLNARSSHTLVNGNKIPLAKVAGMGSGLTFPLLALLTQLSVVASVKRKVRLSYKAIASRIYVYGDDLIVPTEWFDLACIGLTSSGLEVNIDKSFTKGSFRESCGGDYYNGVSVSPVRAKFSGCGLGTTKTDSARSLFKGDLALLQLDRHCRELVKAGLVDLANYYYTQIEKKVPNYGYTSCDSNTLGRYSVEPIYISDEFIHKRLVPTAATIKDARLCPYKYLSSFFSKSEEDTDGLPYGVSAFPRKIKLTTRLVNSINLR